MVSESLMPVIDEIHGYSSRFCDNCLTWDYDHIPIEWGYANCLYAPCKFKAALCLTCDTAIRGLGVYALYNGARRYLHVNCFHMLRNRLSLPDASHEVVITTYMRYYSCPR